MLPLHLDFETRSEVDLLAEGVYRYATHPSTTILCASYAFGDEEIKRWLPGQDCPFDKRVQVHAWNAAFERLIWWYVACNDFSWPDISLESFHCVAALSRANGLPGKLELAARCLNLPSQKDMDGHRLMLRWCKPKTYGPITYDDDAAEFLQLQSYCDDDVKAERGIEKHLRPWTDQELREYWASEHINDRGVAVDVPMARAATRYAEQETKALGDELMDATQGVVTSAKQYQRIKDFVVPKMSPDAVAVLEHYQGGKKKITFDKTACSNLLSMDDESPGFLDPNVREIVELVDLAGRSSVSKYRAMADRELDGRLCGMYWFNGASGTGRFSAGGVQIHNLVRTVAPNASALIESIIANKYVEDIEDEADEDIVHLLAKLVRPAFVAEKDKYLVWCDLAQIEARVAPWLASSPEADLKLAQWANDEPIYERTAESFGLDPIKDRQVGKVAELSMIFLGGKGALMAMARNYGIHLDPDTADTYKSLWRDANPWAQAFGFALDKAARRAVQHPNVEHSVGRVSYLATAETHNGLGTLWCKLPSGRVLAYPNPLIEMLPTPWGEERPQITAIKGNWSPKRDAKMWPRFKVWPGLLVENITQACAADLLRSILVNCLDMRLAGLDVVMHTHDEIVIETTNPKHEAKFLSMHMTDRPTWAKGLPLAAESNYGKRYKVKE